MLWQLLFAFVLFLIGVWIFKQTPKEKNDLWQPLYIFTYVMVFAAALYFTYTYWYYWQLGYQVKTYYNSGAGILYVGNTNQTFFNQNDTQVGDYIGSVRADYVVMTAGASILQFLGPVGVLFSIFYIIHRYYFNRDLLKK